MNQQTNILGVAASLELRPGGPNCIVCADDPQKLAEALKSIGLEPGAIRQVAIHPGPVVNAGPTPMEFARIFHGRQYGEEVSDTEAAALKAAGFVAVFGYSDDCTEFRGAIHDETGYGNLVFSKKGKFFTDADLLGMRELVKDGTLPEMLGINVISAIWGAPGGPEWSYDTDIPHATFDVLEGDHLYCRGIVFRISDLK